MTVFGRPPGHHGSHENGGADEIDVTGLTGVPANLDDLTDVNAPAPADNDTLTWDDATGRWIPEAAAGAAIVPATFVVAAVDSEDTTRADVVCDGTADEVQINAAIAALPATGGSVFLLEGTYDIAAQINLTDNVAIVGTGSGTKITSAASIYIFDGGTHDKVRIANLQIDSAAAIDFVRGTYTNSRFENLWCKTAASADGIAFVAGSSNNVVSRCYLECSGPGATRAIYGGFSDCIIIGNIMKGWFNGINNDGDSNIYANNKVLLNEGLESIKVTGDMNTVIGNHGDQRIAIIGDNNIVTSNRYTAADGLFDTGAGNQIAHNYGV